MGGLGFRGLFRTFVKNMGLFKRIVRGVLVTVLLLALAIPSITYIVLSTPWAQNYLRETAERELTELLGANVEIGRIDYKPFNTMTVSSIAVRDGSGRKALGIGRVAARFELGYFLRTKRLLFDYAVVDSPEINVWRATPDSPLNIDPILQRFKKKDNQKPPASFDLKIGTIILREGILTYNVASEPTTPGRFNPNHISLEKLNLHAYLRHAANDDLDAMIESMSFREKSGFELSDLVVDLTVGKNGTALRDFEIELPSSRFALQPIKLDADGFPQILETFKSRGINFATSEPAVITMADLEAFSPVLGELGMVVRADFDIFASGNEINLKKLKASTADGISADITGLLSGIEKGAQKKVDLEINSVSAPGVALAKLVDNFNPKIAEFARRIMITTISGKVGGNEKDLRADVEIGIDRGVIKADAEARSDDGFKTASIGGRVEISSLPAGTILGEPRLGTVSAVAEGRCDALAKRIEAEGNLNVISAWWNGHEYSGIEASGRYDAEGASLTLTSGDADMEFDLEANYLIAANNTKTLDLDLDLKSLRPENLGLGAWREDFGVSGRLKADFEGRKPNLLNGTLALSDIKLRDSQNSLDIKKFLAEISLGPGDDAINIASDFMNGSIEGEINPIAIPEIFKNMAAHIVPSLLDRDEELRERLASKGLHNKFVADFTFDKLPGVCQYLRLPVTVIYPVDLLASVDSESEIATVSIDAPYLKQGDKIIDSTVASVYFNGEDDRLKVYATTHMPTKKGPMAVVLGVTGAESRFDTRIDWEIERTIPINGLIDFSTAIARSEGGSVCVDTRFNPGQITFGDDVWNIHPSSVEWCDNSLTFNDFRLTAGRQAIGIDGRGSASEDDKIEIELTDITLLSIFETLEIENAMIGGTANGTFQASQILSKIPVLTTDNLHVDSISYNRCVVGTADVAAHWNNEKQSFYLDADIRNPEGQMSKIAGDIYAAAESLDLTFDANHVRVGFMQPFMAAFASEVSGYGSGHARLFGTFHDIDMEGDIYAEDLKLKIDFTNTVYSATDSVHIEPGIIELKDITIRDVNGHTAMLNGVLTHEYFHLPKFDFRVTGARDFLCYNITEAMNPDWYGTIYGNGSASVTGRPGIIEIGANMSTAPGTVFTFVLSDRLEAEQYSFITFNDVTELTVEEKLAEEDLPDDVKEFRERMNAANTDRPSDYLLDFKVDITPDAQMILVMDPVGGDRIRAFGSGDMRLTYNSTENDIRMYGTYTLDRGNYNFTLQDIIIKDFIIDAGSSITFRGDPYSAQLNIEAAYQLNANLTDLDESFALDKDLNRTNVPVQALLKVSGDMRQPDLDFDLRFPTLTSDTYRKVRSIISTEDMMNRQIIYLLALNRFYTPDYMESTTKGNELFSVASSTIASQLSNMLGKLSDKWSIAPNLRSDRGDFSDVEVDVALSSRLLNNRLLLNGNFGYRDKSLNTNQFIGDFDIEYLLTPKGNWRLKGYSRYNDQNYYVRTAPTTQGVGIMFRRDFDSLFPRRRKPRAEQADSAAQDTVNIPLNSQPIIKDK